MAGFLVGARTKLQRFINFDGSLKEIAPHNENDPQASENLNIEELLVPPKAGYDHGREHRLREAVKLVDTTLFRAYMLARPTMAGHLFRLPNFCDVNVVKEKLLETGRYNDLIDFLFGKRRHREALSLLQKLGQSPEDEAPPQLKGPQRTVAYLQNLPPDMIDLMLEYAQWPLQTDPNLGMDIFTADTENAETLPRSAVLGFLQKTNKELAMKYLVHIIDELNDRTPEFHQRLIEIYLAGLRSLDFADAEAKSTWKEKFLDFLKTSQCYEYWKVIRQLSPEGMSIFTILTQRWAD